MPGKACRLAPGAAMAAQPERPEAMQQVKMKRRLTLAKLGSRYWKIAIPQSLVNVRPELEHDPIWN